MHKHHKVFFLYKASLVLILFLGICSLISIFYCANIIFLTKNGQDMIDNGTFQSVGPIFNDIAETNELRTILTYAYISLTIGLSLCFINWFYTLQKDLREKYISFSFSSQSARNVWFIPFWNFIAGPRLMEELWLKLIDNEKKLNWAELWGNSILICLVVPIIKILLYRPATYTDFKYAASQASLSLIIYLINLVVVIITAVLMLKINQFFKAQIEKNPELDLSNHLTNNNS